MTKKIAVINDLSGFGRCSLTAAIPVISVMGAQPCPLPTAVLSAQTGYASFYCDDYTEKMEYFRQEWEKMGVAFDGIYTGYVANEEQISQIFRFLDTFYKGDSFLLVDPVMGDEGRTYKMFTPKLLVQMRDLAARADVITPNLTELCLLTGTEFQEVKAIASSERLLQIVERMARELMARGTRNVVVTGIRFDGDTDGTARFGNDMGGAARFGNDMDGTARIGNLAVTKSGSSRISTFPYVGGSFSGTGDLFASVLAGGLVRGDDIFESVKLAGEFIARAMENTAAEGVERNEGTNFEKYLRMLLPGL